VRKSAFLSALIFGAVLSVSAQMQSEIHLPSNSTWKLNVSETDFGGAPALKSDEFTNITDTKAKVKFTETTVGADGKTMKYSFSAAEDGKMHPVTGINGQTMAFSPDGQLRVAFPDGSTQELKESMTPDGRKVMYDGTMKTKDGTVFKQHWVYDRVK
jgi:hypothetical protein